MEIELSGIDGAGRGSCEIRAYTRIALSHHLNILMGQDDGSWVMSHGSWLMARGALPGPRLGPSEP